MPRRRSPSPAASRGRPRRQPVPLPLERVRRQVDPPRRRPAKQGGPVDRDPWTWARASAAANASGSAGRRRAATAVTVALGSSGGLAAPPMQHRVRADTRRTVTTPLAVQVPDPVGEPHRLPDVPHPVPSVPQLIAGHAPGQRRYHRHRGRPEGQRPATCRNSSSIGVHQRRVERVADPQPPHLAALRSQCPAIGQHGVPGTGDHRRRGPLTPPPPRPRGPPAAAPPRPRWPAPPPSPRPPAAPASGAPRRHQRARIGQRPHPRHVRRRQLADGMPDQAVRARPHDGQQPEQRHLHREQRRLGEPRSGPAARPFPLPAPANITSRSGSGSSGSSARARLVQRRREHRVRRVQLPAHPGPLAALPGEHERHLAAPTPGHAP